MADTIHEFEDYGAKPYDFVMDRGFWKKVFLVMMYEKGVKFALPVPSSVRWATNLSRILRAHSYGKYGKDMYGISSRISPVTSETVRVVSTGSRDSISQPIERITPSHRTCRVCRD